MAARFSTSFGDAWAQKKAARHHLEQERLAKRKAKYAGKVAASPGSPTTHPAMPPPKRRRSESPPPAEPVVEGTDDTAATAPTRTMTVPLAALPPAPPKARAAGLEDRLAALCRRFYRQPYNLQSAWSDRRVNVIVVQMAGTYGAEAALCQWIDGLARTRAAKPFDLADVKVHLSRFLQNVWVARGADGKGVVPVITATTDEMVGWLVDIVNGLPPREKALTFQRLVLVTDNAYDDHHQNMTKLRRMRDRVRVVKVDTVSEECLQRCLGLVVADLNAKSAAHNAAAGSDGPKRTILKLTAPQQRMIVAQSAGDPAFFVNALGYRVLSEGRMNLRALATDSTGMTDFQVGARLLVASMWSHLVEVELPERRVGELQEAVRAKSGMATELGSRSVARRAEPWVRVRVLAPRYSRPDTMAVIRPLGVAAFTAPLIGSQHVTPTVQTFVEVNYQHAVASRAKRAGRRGPKTDLAVLDTMAAVADDLALCDELEAPYMHRAQLCRYSATVRASAMAARGAAAFGDEGYTVDQGEAVDACSRDMASRFYGHLEGVRKRGERRRRLAEVRRQWAVKSEHLRDIGVLTRVRGFWGQHVPVVWSWPDHHARDAARYAAVALHQQPPEPGELAALPGWAEAQRTPPPSREARNLAVWFSQRCAYPHFAGSVAWALAWSSLADGLREGCTLAHVLVAIGEMLREGVAMAGVVKPGVVKARLPPQWLKARFPPRIGSQEDSLPPREVVQQAAQAWALAQSVAAL